MNGLVKFYFSFRRDCGDIVACIFWDFFYHNSGYNREEKFSGQMRYGFDPKMDYIVFGEKIR